MTQVLESNVDEAVALLDRKGNDGGSPTMLEVSNLRVAYGQSEIIHDLSFSVSKGETLAIMGRNGMGKTTLMKSLIGILPSGSGTIAVDGKRVQAFDSWKRVKSGLAFVPQGRQVFPLMTVEENIRTGLETVRKRSIPSYIYDLFPVLKEMRKRRAGNLSGGQQQQLAISRALVSNPKVLLLDEPTEGIQPSIIKDIARALNEIKKMRDLTIVVSEQVLSFTLEIADRILVVESGRIVHEDLRSQVDEAKIARYLSV
ncbi:MAG TPA: urea ABC transporter ATP-binding subunit UrtE [Tepidisphaeraceae bacterium]|jgi:urea transport system ATP-binding protein